MNIECHICHWYDNQENWYMISKLHKNDLALRKKFQLYAVLDALF